MSERKLTDEQRRMLKALDGLNRPVRPGEIEGSPLGNGNALRALERMKLARVSWANRGGVRRYTITEQGRKELTAQKDGE